LILHDADMLVLGNYTKNICDTLDNYEACHLGGTVIYTTEKSMHDINDKKFVNLDIECDRAVGYYEGGSLACSKEAYWRVGGFNEDFDGYGCEDCDFFVRLSNGSKWTEDRTFDLLHLWHSRVDGWNQHHNVNKQLEIRLNRMSIGDRIAMQVSKLKELKYI
jgi:predicted glycosyltransferase involved in capsule biosynthesis